MPVCNIILGKRLFLRRKVLTNHICTYLFLSEQSMLSGASPKIEFAKPQRIMTVAELYSSPNRKILIWRRIQDDLSLLRLKCQLSLDQSINYHHSLSFAIKSWVCI